MSEDEKRRRGLPRVGARPSSALSVDRANPVHRVTDHPRSIGALE